jgi:hypothetical protein
VVVVMMICLLCSCFYFLKIKPERFPDSSRLLLLTCLPPKRTKSSARSIINNYMLGRVNTSIIHVSSGSIVGVWYIISTVFDVLPEPISPTSQFGLGAAADTRSPTTHKRGRSCEKPVLIAATTFPPKKPWHRAFSNDSLWISHSWDTHIQHNLQTTTKPLLASIPPFLFFSTCCFGLLPIPSMTVNVSTCSG